MSCWWDTAHPGDNHQLHAARGETRAPCKAASSERYAFVKATGERWSHPLHTFPGIVHLGKSLIFAVKTRFYARIAFILSPAGYEVDIAMQHEY